MIVLSLFDGMSCGQIALQQLGIKVNKFAIAQTKEPKPRNCGNCLLCIHTYMGSECSLTDNAVDDAQDGCIDYIPED